MSRITRVPFVIALLFLAAFAAGCGGSDSAGSGETTTATTEGAERLTTAQWDEYQASSAALTKATASATKKLDACSDIAGFQDTSQLQACVGDTFSVLSTAAGGMTSTLKSFDGTVSGPCAQALVDLLNYAGTYQASAEGMERTIESETLAGYPAASQNLKLAASAGKDQATTFEKDCAPV